MWLQRQHELQQYAKKNGIEFYRQKTREQLDGETKSTLPDVAKARKEMQVLTNMPKTAKIVTEFPKAKTVNEASELAVNNGLSRKANYKGVDVSVANIWNQSVYEAQEKYPVLKGKFDFIGEAHQRNAEYKTFREPQIRDALLKMHPNISAESLERSVKYNPRRELNILKVGKDTMAQYAKTNGINGVTVNNAYGKDATTFEKTLVKAEGTKFHPEGTATVKAVADHEIGHSLDDAFGLNKNSEIRNLYKGLSANEIENGLSRYANYNIGEFIAEAYSEYANNPNPRDISKKVGEIIDEENEKWIKLNLLKK